MAQLPYRTPIGLRQFRPPSPRLPWKPYLETTSVPCYMDFYTHGSTLAVTVLGTNYYSTFFIYDDTIHKYEMASLKAWSGRRLRRPTGVFVDHDGMAVVAGAAARKIHIFDRSDYHHVNEVRLVDENNKPLQPPYISGLFNRLHGSLRPQGLQRPASHLPSPNRPKMSGIDPPKGNACQIRRAFFPGHCICTAFDFSFCNTDVVNMMLFFDVVMFTLL